jgi:peptidyl-prolyl cis-trans isomerase D
LSGFKTTKNTIVNSNSDVPYDSTYIAKKDLPAVDADQLFNLPPGEVYGPYVLETTMPFQNRWAKNGVNAKASHILISYEGTKVPNKKSNELKKKKVKARLY